MQHSHRHLRSIPNSALPGPDCERRELWRYLILPQHLLPWHSVCWNTAIPSPGTVQMQGKRGEKGVFHLKKCSTSEFITCILWVKPAGHKELTDSWQSLRLCPAFSMSFLFGLQSSWSLSDKRESRLCCTALTQGTFCSGRSNFHLRQSPKGVTIKGLQD